MIGGVFLCAELDFKVVVSFNSSKAFRKRKQGQVCAVELRHT